MHAHGGERRALATALVLVLAFSGVEAAVGVVADSLALLADAAHMLSDALALGLALFAAWLAHRPATPERSFGWRRAEVLAALANALVLVVLGAWIVWEGVGRLSDPPGVTGGWVLAAGVAGMLVNLAAARVLHGAGSGLNIRAAKLHVLADLASSAGVVVAGLVVLATGWAYADPIAAAAIGLWVLPRAWSLARRSLRVLLEAAPADLDVSRLQADLADLPGVVDVHDLHVWTLTSDMDVASAHLVTRADTDPHGVLDRARDVLRLRYEITHATLQVEPDDHEGCAEVNW
jgi:cobalt-zinc-cadmium efflux system protein